MTSFRNSPRRSERRAFQGGPSACQFGAEKASGDCANVGGSDGRAQLSDLLLGLPWGKKSKLKKDIAEAQEAPRRDHYGLEKVEERIVEHRGEARTNKLKGPILCLVGPPGVGKTSLGRSIARATGREFVRQSLGGVRDEAEIRGAPAAYIGSLPGKIISTSRKPGHPTRCSCSTRSISLVRISAGTHPRHCWKCLIPSRTTSSRTIISS